MWPYILLLVFPLLIQHIKFRGSTLRIAKFDSKSKSAMIVFWAILFILLVLRHESIGIDLENYQIIFDYISRSSWQDALGRSAEIGYSFMNKVILLFTDDFRWVIVVSAVLSICFIAKAYVEYSEDASLTIVLFVISSNFILLFSGLRQAIAISLGFVAFEFVRKKKLIPFIIITILAMTFHTSAFMILFMYPLYHMKIKKSWLLVIVPMLGVLLVFNRQIFGVLTTFLSMFTKYDAEIKATNAYTTLMLYVVFAVFSYLVPDETKLDKDTIGMRNFLLFAVALQMFAPLHNLAMRMNYYYIAFIPLLMTRVIKCRSKRYNQVAIAARHVMVVFFLIYFFISAPSDNSLQTFPYHFLWENVS